MRKYGRFGGQEYTVCENEADVRGFLDRYTELRDHLAKDKRLRLTPDGRLLSVWQEVCVVSPTASPASGDVVLREEDAGK
jgi:hypothetical protein